jgi:hypothetical protein
LDYRGIENFGNIDLSGTASVNASGIADGAINIRGANVTLRDRANLISDTLGNIAGRDIDIQSSQFNLQDRALVRAATLGTAGGGNIAIRATDSVLLPGISFEDFQRNYEATLNGTVNPSNRHLRKRI